jgi:di/tricarboxylate transporter
MSTSTISQLALSLDRAAIFSDLSSEEKARLLPMVSEVVLAAGAPVFKRGEQAHDLFLVLEGEIEVSSELESSVVKTGGYCGEEAAVGCARYMSDATARGTVRALKISHDALIEPLQQNPSVRRDLWLSLVSHLAGAVEAKPAAVPKSEAKRASDTMASVGWLLTLLLPVAVLLGGGRLGITYELKLFLAIMSSTVSMWIFRLVPDFVPGFFAILSVIILGLTPVQVILEGFSSPGFFMAMSVLGLSAVVVSSGLSLRVMLWLLRRMPHNQFSYELTLLMIGALLTPIVPPSSGRVALTAPLLSDMIHILRCQRGGRAATRLSAATFIGATMFSGIFLSGGGSNFVIYGLMSAQLQEQFQWVYWLFAASVCGVVMLVAYLIVSRIAFRNQEPLPLSDQIIDMQLKVLGPMSIKEWAAACGVLLFGVAVATSSVHKIGPAWLALAVMYGLMLFNFLRQNEFREAIDWAFLMFLGGLVGLVNAMLYLGVDKLLSAKLGWTAAMMHESPALFVLALSAIVIGVRFILPISLTMVILATVFMPIASLNGMNPWFVGFIILVMAESWFFPYQNTSYVQFRSFSNKPYNEGGFTVLNLAALAIRLLGLYASLPFWHHLGIL